ncbi:hypothetical protein DSM104299_00655 [Baekduia alba]|uniref:PKD domain-containing protein n=1 Tax=Baekduia alba TaxID=2997333 RepID=UPI00233FA96A|nr:PKD domain-containing protein [Baekduia alba]WCB91974.1 hypothetical protein DSM104299_00655 [Baekduia alba]
MIALSDGNEVAVAWVDSASGSIAARLGTFGQPFTSAAATFASGGSAPSVDMTPTGRTAVIWGANPGPSLHTALREAGGSAFTETAPITSDLYWWYGNVAVTPVLFDGAGDAIAAWGAAGSREGFSVLDVTGPELRAVNVPGSATAGTAVGGFSVATFDTFSAVGTPHWDFGDGAGADGGSVSHTYNNAGTYTIKVTATDAVGNATSATRSIAVGAAVTPPATTPPGVKPPPVAKTPAKCKVPKLTGLTYAQAKAKLTSAHCKVGKTTKPKGRKTTKNLVVKAQSRKAGTSTTSGAKVDITMKVKPKPKHKKAKKH